jgi:ACT domain-containing protein
MVQPKKGKKIVIAVIGRDQVGIVAKVATVLAENNVNIEDINQKVFAGDVFAMTMLADISGSALGLAEINAKLDEAVGPMGLKVTIQDTELFQYMHRV